MAGKDILKEPYGTFLVFETTHLTMKAESILKGAGMPMRLFPKPRSVESKCGLVIKVPDGEIERASEICSKEGLEIKEILKIEPD